MSINILTASGLVNLSGDKITKDSIISALGYVPADEESLPNIVEDESGELYIADENGNVIMKVDANGLSTTEVSVNGILLGEAVAEHSESIDTLTTNVKSHTSDTDVHITSEERELWNDKDYNNLENKPNITEDGSDSLQITDNSGNVIMQVDANGLETTTVTAQSVIVNGTDIGSHIDDTVIHISQDEREKWDSVDNKASQSDLDSHTTDTTVHITANERTAWNAKADLTYVDEQISDIDEQLSSINSELDTKANTSDLHSHDNKDLLDAYTGSYNDLTDTPIVDDGSEALQIVDNSGNIVMTVDANGLETTQVIANTITSSVISIDGVDVKTKLNTIDSTISIHIDESDNRTDKLHITDEERTKWNAKSEFSGDYNDLENAPNITEDESDDLVITDNNENIIFRVSGNGVETTTLTAQNVVVNGIDVELALDGKANNDDIPDIVDNLVTTDSTKALSAAQGAALKTAIDSITTDIGDLGGGDMMKATYDTDNNGIVDNAERLEGYSASYFASTTYVDNAIAAAITTALNTAV